MTRAKWRAMRILNSHLLVTRYTEETGEYGVYLGYSSNDGQRMNMGVPTGYVVRRPGYNTDPTGTLTGEYNKIFHTFRFRGTLKESWEQCYFEAEVWTRAKYNLGPFGPIPGFGRDRFPSEIIAWAKETLKAAKP